MTTENRVLDNHQFPWINSINHPVVLLTTKLIIAHSNDAFNTAFNIETHTGQASLCDYLTAFDGSDAEHLSTFFERGDPPSFYCRFKTLCSNDHLYYEAHISNLNAENTDLIFCSLQENHQFLSF